jgi:UDP-N-acetylglucosamine 2-epimerase (non-hydrolysing)
MQLNRISTGGGSDKNKKMVEMKTLFVVGTRPEAVIGDTVRLVGTDQATVALEASRLLEDAVAYASIARASNPYGGGDAAQRIRDILVHAC